MEAFCVHVHTQWTQGISTLESRGQGKGAKNQEIPMHMCAMYTLSRCLNGIFKRQNRDTDSLGREMKEQAVPSTKSTQTLSVVQTDHGQQKDAFSQD